MDDNKQRVKKQLKRFKNKHGEKYEYPYIFEEYVNTVNKITVICPKHGESKQTPQSHLLGGGCRKCGVENRVKSWEETEKGFRGVHGDKYEYVKSSYTKGEVKMKIICPIHGQFEQSPHNHKFGQGCKKCGRIRANKKVTMTWEELEPKFKAVHGDTYTYLDKTFQNTKNKMVIICKKHGAFKQTPDAHRSGKGCYKCNKEATTSKGENEVVSFIKSLGLEVKQSDRSVLRDKEIDILIPEKRVGIEYCGEYFHSECMGRYMTYHKNKFIDAKKADIHLITIFEKEWQNKTEILKSILRHKLGKSEKTINARQCKIIELTNIQRKKYFNSFHVQGAPKQADYTIGLVFKEEVVCAMSFNKARFGNGDFELTRYACLPDTNIRGGFSKLLKNWCKNNQSCELVSYVDHRIGVGESYLLAGFKKVNDVQPSYFWNKGFKNINKRKARHSKLATLLGDMYDPNKTEKQNMERAGWSRVWDCGKTKFVLKT